MRPLSNVVMRLLTTLKFFVVRCATHRGAAKRSSQRGYQLTNLPCGGNDIGQLDDLLLWGDEEQIVHGFE